MKPQEPKRTERITVEEFRALAQKQNAGGGSRKSKYGNKKTGGYDSTKEYRRAQRLKLLLAAGEISDLREQVPFPLIPSQTNAEGVTERAVKYIADFVYKDKQGNLIVEDTKGFRTPEYILKRKLMLQVHGITIKEI